MAEQAVASGLESGPFLVFSQNGAGFTRPLKLSETSFL
jgi:hypothetical protein